MKTQTIRIEHPLARGTEVTERDLWDFPEGLIGLPDHRRFAVLPLPAAPPFRLLVSPDDPSFALVVVDPSALVPDYELTLASRELTPLVERDPSRLEILVPVVLPRDAAPLTLNLKGPIVLSGEERRGIQRVSPDERHVVRYVPDLGKAGAASCSS
jgi:flagellar assembly factor FliW